MKTRLWYLGQNDADIRATIFLPFNRLTAKAEQDLSQNYLALPAGLKLIQNELDFIIACNIAE